MAVSEGAQVRVLGLAGRPELNGLVGTAIQFVAAKGRWKVVLKGQITKDPLAVKPENLEVLHVQASVASPSQTSKFIIKAIEGKGLGMVAACSIGKGELILAEEPALVVLARDLLVAEAEGRHAQERLVRQHVDRLSVDDQKAFWALCDPDAGEEQKSAYGIWRANCIGSDTNREHVVCFTAARFNHSCKPNVMRLWIASDGKEFFRAVREIEPGEELCIYYMDVFCSRAERQTALMRAYGFICQCEACSLQGNEQHLSDSIRKEYQDLDAQIGQMQDFASAVGLVRRIVDILETEFDGYPLWIKRACWDGFQLALAAGDSQSARCMILKAIEAQIHSEGDHDNEKLRKWRRYATDPNGLEAARLDMMSGNVS